MLVSKKILLNKQVVPSKLCKRFRFMISNFFIFYIIRTNSRSAPEMSTRSLQRPIMDQSSHGTANTLPLVQRGPPPTAITQQERFQAQDMRSPSPYDTVDRNYRPSGAVPMFPGLDEPDAVVSREPVYAQVRSQNHYAPNGAPSNNADSWV